MKKHAVIALATAALFLASQAQAFTLTNRDTVDQRLKIVEEGDQSETHDVVIGAEQTLEDLCANGCTIGLDNGQEETFEGYETVYIEDGSFVIGE